MKKTNIELVTGMIQNRDELAKLIAGHDVSLQFQPLAAADTEALKYLYHTALQLAREYYMQTLELKLMLMQKETKKEKSNRPNRTNK